MVTLPVPLPSSPWDDEWLSKQREIAFTGLKDVGYSGFMEIRMSLPNTKLNIPQTGLLNAANQAPIHTFGWPIGIVLGNRDEYRPRPTTEGILAEINIKNGRTGRKSYDYWAIRRDGTFYLLMNLFEDMVESGKLFFNTRIVRITEALLYTVRLYSYLDVPNDSQIIVGIRHGGLKDRILSATQGYGAYYISENKSLEDEIYTEIKTTFEKIESNLVELVENFTQPLFILFDFFEMDKSSLENIVNNFVAGRVM